MDLQILQENGRYAALDFYIFLGQGSRLYIKTVLSKAKQCHKFWTGFIYVESHEPISHFKNTFLIYYTVQYKQLGP
jgi:hypothetical protein